MLSTDSLIYTTPLCQLEEGAFSSRLAQPYARAHGSVRECGLDFSPHPALQLDVMVQ